MPAHLRLVPISAVPNARVRQASVLDAAGVAAAAGSGRTEAEWAALLGDPGSRTTWVADRGGAVVGVLLASAVGTDRPRTLELELLRVGDSEPPATGAHLLAVALGDAPCFAVVPTADTGQLELLAAQGFAPAGERGPDRRVVLVR